MLASFYLLTKDIYSDHTEKTAEWPTVHISINEEEKTSRQNAHAFINSHPLLTSIGELQVIDITPVWHLSITESMLVNEEY